MQEGSRVEGSVFTRDDKVRHIGKEAGCQSLTRELTDVRLNLERFVTRKTKALWEQWEGKGGAWEQTGLGL